MNRYEHEEKWQSDPQLAKLAEELDALNQKMQAEGATFDEILSELHRRANIQRTLPGARRDTRTAHRYAWAGYNQEINL